MTKLAGEQLAFAYWRNYQVPVVALRYFTVYGPRQRPDMAFNRFIRNMLDGCPIEVYGDGEQTRDFTYVDDAVEANLAAATTDVTGQALNIGGGSCVTVNQVLRLLREIIGRQPTVHYVQSQRGDVRRAAADTSAAARVLRYSPSADLAAGLRAQVVWALTNGMPVGQGDRVGPTLVC